MCSQQLPPCLGESSGVPGKAPQLEMAEGLRGRHRLWDPCWALSWPYIWEVISCAFPHVE